MIDRWQDISRFGLKVVRSGLTNSRFGNISVRRGEGILITRTGSMLDEIDPSQVVEVDLSSPCSLDYLASCEAVVHKAIYRATGAEAIIHTHSPYAVTLSLLEELLEPLDGEGRAFLGDVPVIKGGFGTEALAENAAKALVCHRACIARGHGVFAPGASLREAYDVACMVEHSSQVNYLLRLGQAP